MIYIDTTRRIPLYLDFDCTIFNSIQRICDLYNADYRYHEGFVKAEADKIQQYDFSDICPLASPDVIESYFNTPRFFDVENHGGYYWMSHEESNRLLSTKGYIDVLNKWFRIVIVTKGNSSNLNLKEMFIRKHFPYADFIGVTTDKSEVDMTGGIFVDDDIDNLRMSKADEKKLYGKKYPWHPKRTAEDKKTIAWHKTWQSLYDDLYKRYGV